MSQVSRIHSTSSPVRNFYTTAIVPGKGRNIKICGSELIISGGISQIDSDNNFLQFLLYPLVLYRFSLEAPKEALDSSSLKTLKCLKIKPKTE